MLLVAAPAVVSTVSPVSTADGVQYFWRWSDGSRSQGRTFADPLSGAVALPDLVVASAPAVRGRLVVLQFRDDGRWHTEDAARTDDKGIAVVALNPYCSDGAWCDRTLDYRLRVDGQDAAVRVTFDG